jgi:hypothetical protein
VNYFERARDFITVIFPINQYGGERVLYLQKKKLREISVSFWSDVLLCLSEAKPHTYSSVNDILSSDILNFSSLDDFPYYLLWKNRYFCI